MANWKIIKPTNEEQKKISKSSFYHSVEKTCLLCGSKFDYGQKSKVICDGCKIITKCIACNKEVTIDNDRLKNYSGTKQKSIIEAIINGLDLQIMCNKSCSNTSRYDFGTCPNCKTENVKIYNSRCSYCANKELNSSIDCPIHGFQSCSFGGICIICHNTTEQMKQQASEIGKIYGAKNSKIMNDYNKQFFNQHGMYPFQKEMWRQINEKEREYWPGNCTPRLIIKDGVRYYKDIEVNEFASKILSGDLNIEDYPGINIRFGKVFYRNEDIKTGEIKKFSHRSFQEIDDVLYYFDKSNGNYIPWEEFKCKFITFNIDFKLPKGFEMYSTFRTQESKDWSGAGCAFEQNLVENNISWFVYIKFYIDENGKFKPLVAGKSGSFLVNTNGSDVSFSTDINDGPARRFLQENNLDWCKTQIAICSCKTEQEALELEKQIQRDFGLLGG